jgi:hypothetical protein
MSERSRALRRGPWTGVAVIAVAACSGKGSGAEFTLHFPSIAAAVTRQEVGYYAFNADNPGTDCVSLVLAYQNKTSLPTALYTSPLATPCELTANPGLLAAPLGYGHLSVLVFSTRASDGGVQDFLIGCSSHNFTSSEVSSAGGGGSIFDVYLSLENADNPPPSATTCSGLTAYCAGQCK